MYNCKTSYRTFSTFRLPIDDISVPIGELPDPESDNGNSGETLRQLEAKWTDLALTGLADSVNSA